MCNYCIQFALQHITASTMLYDSFDASNTLGVPNERRCFFSLAQDLDEKLLEKAARFESPLPYACGALGDWLSFTFITCLQSDDELMNMKPSKTSQSQGGTGISIPFFLLRTAT